MVRYTLEFWRLVFPIIGLLGCSKFLEGSAPALKWFYLQKLKNVVFCSLLDAVI